MDLQSPEDGARSVRHACEGWRAARLVLVLLCLAMPVHAAPKIDVVVLENGERVTCEIKVLERGRLEVSTDAFDTIRIYWGRIREIISPRQFEIERGGGERLYGSLVQAPAKAIRLQLAGAAGIDVPLDDVVLLTPIEASFWQRLDGHVDLGFSFAKADLETRYTLNADADYRNRKYGGSLVLASQITEREDADRLARTSLTLTGSRDLGHRWSALLLGQVQQNEELSLDLRTVASGAIGRYLAQTVSTRLIVFGGAAYTRERFTGEPTGNLAELIFGGDWDWFTVRDNAVDVSTYAIGFYGLNGDSRARLEVQSAMRVEFLKDFYFSVNGYGSFDSSPPEGRSGSDVGVSLALGWSF